MCLVNFLAQGIARCARDKTHSKIKIADAIISSPETALVAYAALRDVGGADDFIGDAVRFLFLVLQKYRG